MAKVDVNNNPKGKGKIINFRFTLGELVRLVKKIFAPIINFFKRIGEFIFGHVRPRRKDSKVQKGEMYCPGWWEKLKARMLGLGHHCYDMPMKKAWCK